MSYGKDKKDEKIKKESQQDLDTFRKNKREDDEVMRRTKSEGLLQKSDPNYRTGYDYTGTGGRIQEGIDYGKANKSGELFMQKRESLNSGLFSDLASKLGRPPTLAEMTEARRKNDATLYSGMTLRGETPTIDFGTVEVRDDSSIEAPDQKPQQFFEAIDRLNQDDREIRDQVRGPRKKK